MNIKVFKNIEFGAVRVLRDENNEPWFIAKDVCEILGLSNITETLKRVDEADLTSVKLNSGGQLREFKIVNESGLYQIIFMSKKESAKKFKRWVTSEVLPAIRKYGAYIEPHTLQKMITDPNFTKSLLETLYQTQLENQKLQNKVTLLSHTKKTYTTSEIAKELGFKSANELNKKLKELGIQYKVNGTWVLSAKYANKGYVEIKQGLKADGTSLYYTRWTQKGREFLLELFSKQLTAS